MIKMNELSRLSDTPKSTILYYVKEGLLPEPDKPKPNLYLYDESVVEIVKFIKYLQTNFNASIAEIKALFQSPDFNTRQPYCSLLSCLDIIMGYAHTKIYDKDELCMEFDIAQDILEGFVKSGLISPRNGVFTAKEREILAILVTLNKDELKLVKTYAKIATKLSKDEINLAKATKSHKRLFDIILLLRPYIFNMQTLNAYKRENQ